MVSTFDKMSYEIQKFKNLLFIKLINVNNIIRFNKINCFALC
jgi:hypothetical protein